MRVYGDGAWPSELPATLVTRGESLHWLDFSVPLRRIGDDETAAAATVLVSLAAEAAARASRGGPGSVATVGDGLVAAAVRRRLGASPLDDSDGDLDAVVETVGTEEAAARAMAALRPFGTLVLAAPMHAALRVNLYPQAHVRGLSIVGAAPPLVRDPAWSPRLELRAEAAAVPPPGAPGEGAPWWCGDADGE